MKKQDLKDLVKEKLSDQLLVVVSNREPVIHNYHEEEIRCIRPASGLVTALEPVVKTCSGIWVAHGSGSADRAVTDEAGRVMVTSPGDERGEEPYTLKRVWISKEEEEGYYYGFSNRSLWPLCHIVYLRPRFNADDWLNYKEVNSKFARAILDEIGSKKAFVFIQDYHFALLPRLLKGERPDLTIAQFWHIPWPNPEAFRICPFKDEILEGLLANDMLGFHLEYFCDNFMAAAKRELGAAAGKKDLSLTHRDKTTLIKAWPISVDFEQTSRLAESNRVEELKQRFTKEFNLRDKIVLFGLDRLDYTKGIIEKFEALDRFLEKYPDYLGKVVLLQKGTLSRLHIPEYKRLNDRINAVVEKLNWKYSSNGWTPAILTRRDLDYDGILALYRLADVCIVSSLHDGMNLVAKEFISARNDLGGRLILSRFAGAFNELGEEAIGINPYDIEAFADRIKEAIEVDEEEARRRMGALRKVVSSNDIYDWIGKIASDLAEIGS
ncbi:MAG: trehalose-6-phosphate synthase [Actinomycetota bacterium]|nr:trehalose-6-phosphate synthase [Actinomycetota bacterium]